MKDIVSLQEKEFGKEIGFIHEGLITLRKVGMTRALWTRLTESEKLARKVVAYIKQGGHKPTPTQKGAKQIMGKNFVAVREVVQHYGLLLLKEEVEKVPQIPFSEKRLKKHKNTHILFPVFLGPVHDPDPGLKWFLMNRLVLKEVLRIGWKPYLQLGGQRLPLRPFLVPLVKT